MLSASDRDESDVFALSRGEGDAEFIKPIEPCLSRAKPKRDMRLDGSSSSTGEGRWKLD